MDKRLGKKRGIDILHDPRLNKGTAFTGAERAGLGLSGLLPPRYNAPEEQLARVHANLTEKDSNLEKYLFLIGLLDRNETLFYRLLADHLEELMPIIYTPTVGLACQKYSRIFSRPRGLYISLEDRGQINGLLSHWPYQDIRIIVVTDGERILGLGDLGVNGMGIPVGKLSLYVAAAGIDPSQTLPVCLDTGTGNAELRRDPLYLGLDRERERGPAYDELLAEFIQAVHGRWPRCIIQFEDFANANAHRLLAQYRGKLPAFNDDIQGTGAVALAGLLGAIRITGEALAKQRIVFAGAGSAAIGIAETIARALVDEGLPQADAHRRFWLMDSKGLLTTDRHERLNAQQQPYARHEAPAAELAAVVERVHPTVLIGISGQPGLFNETVIRSMSSAVERPIIFALSNPTSRSECTAEQAYRWSAGKAIFAAGSPFDPLELQGRWFRPGQGNNVYIFPGVGLGAIASGAKMITDAMFQRAAVTLARAVPDTLLAEGCIYPPLADIRRVSLEIAVAVAREAYDQGLASEPEPEDLSEGEAGLRARLESAMWEPRYPTYR